jgi:K+-sensing histidine kinase KdpD
MMAALLGLAWTLVVVALDVQTGFQLKLGPFYLLPVLLVAWAGGVLQGLVAAILAAAVWRGIDLVWRPAMVSGWVLVFDAFIHLLAFAAVALFVAWARSLVERERKLVRELSEVLANVRELEGLLPMCAWCKKVRDDQGYWQQIETYISAHTKADCTHGICPECQAKYMESLDHQEASPEGEGGRGDSPDDVVDPLVENSRPADGSSLD